MRMLVRALAGLALMGVLAGAAMPLRGDALTVKTAQGKVQGKTTNDGKVKAFLGLPYAAPPVGELRWKAPEGPAKWKGVRDATKYGSRCEQGRVYSDMVFLDPGPSEDCLFLNVYAPAAAKGNSKLPVMFWIHGGGYSGGASSEPRHSGDALPTKGVVLVTINYRLGVLGFMATEEMAKEADGHAGNFGLLDMVAALRWVNANIAKFGGDPKNVTIFGESAGSFAVSTLMASPMAQGLFAKAIGESGAAFGGVLPTATLEAREKRDGDWAAGLGAKSLAELRALPVATLIEAGQAKGAPGFGPVVDGRLLVEPVPVTYAAGRQAHVPLLAGWNRDENVALAKEMTMEKWKAYATTHFDERADAFLKVYAGETDELAARAAADFSSDQWIAFGTWQWIEAQRKTGGEPVYRYHFELAAPPSKYHAGSYAFHSDDIEYVFGALDSRPGAEWRPEDRKLSEQMMSYWTNFAKTGDPNGEGLPVWPKFGEDNAIIHLDAPITAGPSAVEGRYEFLMKGVVAP